MKVIERIPLASIDRLEIYINSGRKTSREIWAETKADYVTNLVYFTNKWKPTCQLKQSGTVLVDDGNYYYGLGWNTGSDIDMAYLPGDGDRYENYFACMCAVKDGAATPKLYYNSDVGGKRGHLAIGVTTGAELLLYASHDGIDADTPEGVRDELAAMGDVESAIICDGGTKVTLLGPVNCLESGVDTVQNLLLVYLKKEDLPMGVKTYSLKKDGRTKLSANFAVKEFACNDGSDTILISDELVELLQKIRDHFGKAVTINSGYRTAAYNTKIGGATKSQHILGTAADITIKDAEPLEVAQYAEYLQPTAGGIGVYQSFTHVDVRVSRSRWDNRSGSEVVVSGWPGYTEAAPTEADLAVEWVKENGVMLGDTNGDMMLEAALSRKQFAVMLYRYHKLS